MTLVLSVLEQGMIYAVMALGIYITYTILDFPDLTVDGSFPLGATFGSTYHQRSKTHCSHCSYHLQQVHLQEHLPDLSM